VFFEFKTDYAENFKGGLISPVKKFTTKALNLTAKIFVRKALRELFLYYIITACK